MPKVFEMGARDEEFLLNEANGFRSRDIRVVKTGEIAEPGTVIIAEHELTTGETPVLVATGLHVAATAARLTEWTSLSYAALDIAIIARGKDASEADVTVAVIDCDAEVKGSELKIGTGADIDDVRGLLASVGIKIRQAI